MMGAGNLALPPGNVDDLGNQVYPSVDRTTIIEPYVLDEIHRALLGDVTTITAADSPHTLTRERSLLLVDCTDGPVTVNLPAASDLAQMQFHIRKTAGPATNPITIDPADADTVDGDATATISFVGTTLTVQSDGASGWWSV